MIHLYFLETFNIFYYLKRFLTTIINIYLIDVTKKKYLIDEK